MIGVLDHGLLKHFYCLFLASLHSVHRRQQQVYFRVILIQALGPGQEPFSLVIIAHPQVDETQIGISQLLIGSQLNELLELPFRLLQFHLFEIGQSEGLG